MNKEDREKRIIELWLERPMDRRTMIDLLAFTGDLQTKAPSLLQRIEGDPYQRLKTVLRRHITDF